MEALTNSPLLADDLLTYRDLAAVLRVSYWTARRAALGGRFGPVLLVSPHSPRVRASAVAAFLDSLASPRA